MRVALANEAQRDRSCGGCAAEMADRARMNGDTSQVRQRRSGRGRRPLQALLVALAAVVVIAAVVMLLRFREPPQRAAAEVAIPAISAREPDVPDIPVRIHARGYVSPATEVEIMPEVAGTVIFTHSELKEGGVIRAGEKIVQIDPRDCELAVRKARAMVAEAQARLDIETSGADIRRRDWRQLHPGAEPDSPLVFGEPMVQQARASLDLAKAQLAAEELRLQRTVVSMPFDVLIVGKNVDLGQYVAVGQPLATAYGVDTFEITISLNDEELAQVDGIEAWFPSSSDPAEKTRIPVELKVTFGGKEQTWQGYIAGTTGRVDRASGAIAVVVEVPEPLDTSGARRPLLPGASVDVFIACPTPEDAVTAPRDRVTIE